MAYLDPKMVKGTVACQETGDRVQMDGTMRRGTRRIWRKLDYLNPNLQDGIWVHTPETRLKPVPFSCIDIPMLSVHPPEYGRCPMRVFKEMSGAPKFCCHVRYGMKRGIA
jgi:hypothetical protein